jgi:hypothetical protein
VPADRWTWAAVPHLFEIIEPNGLLGMSVLRPRFRNDYIDSWFVNCSSLFIVNLCSCVDDLLDGVRSSIIGQRNGITYRRQCNQGDIRLGVD